MPSSTSASPTGHLSLGTSEVPPTRSLRPVTAPTGQQVLSLMLPALATALDGSGPALLPLPTGAARRQTIDTLRPDLPVETDEVALVVPTSGSTDVPKGALLTTRALRASAAATHERLGGPGQWLLALPVTHMAGLMVLVRSLAAGTQPQVLDLYGGFDTGAFASATARLSAAERRYTSLVPTQLRRLLDAGIDLTAYDAILLGGAPAPDPLLAQAGEAGARVVTSYGMTETCGGCVYDGRPLDGVDISVGEDGSGGAGEGGSPGHCGRISIGGPVLFSGYRLRPDLTAEALVEDRYRTNDVGRWSSDGRLEVLGRTDDVIVSGALKVSAAVVERVLNAHPEVRLCAVVAQPDDEWGERVVAVIEPRTWGHVPSLDDLRAFAAASLDPAALPREVVVLGILPMLASGKPDRLAVRTVLAARSASPGAARSASPGVGTPHDASTHVEASLRLPNVVESGEA